MYLEYNTDKMLYVLIPGISCTNPTFSNYVLMILLQCLHGSN